jgi:hypothetical protein
MIPPWLRPLRPLWIASHLWRRWRAGHFSLAATSYAIYTKRSPAQRVEFKVSKPTAVWWNRI